MPSIVSTQFILHKFLIFSLCLNVVKSKNFKQTHFQTNDSRTYKSMKTMFIATMHFISNAIICHVKFTYSSFHFINSSILRDKFSYSLFIFSTGICAHLSSQVLKSSSVVAGLYLAILPFKSDYKASMIYKSGDWDGKSLKQHISQLSMKDDTTLDLWDGAFSCLKMSLRSVLYSRHSPNHWSSTIPGTLWGF